MNKMMNERGNEETRDTSEDISVEDMNAYKKKNEEGLIEWKKSQEATKGQLSYLEDLIYKRNRGDLLKELRNTTISMFRATELIEELKE